MRQKNKKERAYSRYSKDAAVLLGKQIRLERVAHRLSARDVAERAGISRTTLQKIEQGDLKCELGLVLEAAALVGVKLFDVESSFSSRLESVNDKLALLPKSVRKRATKADDDF